MRYASGPRQGRRKTHREWERASRGDMTLFTFKRISVVSSARGRAWECPPLSGDPQLAADLGDGGGAIKRVSHPFLYTPARRGPTGRFARLPRPRAGGGMQTADSPEARRRLSGKIVGDARRWRRTAARAAVPRRSWCLPPAARGHPAPCCTSCAVRSRIFRRRVPAW